MEKKTDPRLLNKDWRMSHLYSVTSKAGGKTVRFVPNGAQKVLFQTLRDKKKVITLKSRQLGITTGMAIWLLDEVLFTRNINALTIMQAGDHARTAFDTKVQFAWKNLDIDLKTALGWTINTDRANQLTFGFGDGTSSTYAVANSGRSGTFQYVHISELAALAATRPLDAREVITGTLPAIPHSGYCLIESTANGEIGYFADYWRDAVEGKNEFHPIFLNWRHDIEEIESQRIIQIEAMPTQFAELKERHNLSDKELSYYFSKWKLLNGDWHLLRQEYPTCVSSETKIETPYGLVKIKDAVVDGSYVLAKYNKGKKETFSVLTERGFRLSCTAEHPILTPSGFIKLEKLNTGDKIKLALSSAHRIEKEKIIEFKDLLAVSRTTITPEIARFLGIFMGDGSFYGEQGTLSVACCAEDYDFVEQVKSLIAKLFGEPKERTTGSNGGCREIRISNKRLLRQFNELGLLRQNSSLAYKRKIHVPAYIKESPREVVVEFLKGLFETDGFVDRSGNRIVFFSKYEDFIRDVQILLLRFGIVSRIRTAEKKTGEFTYVGYDLTIGKLEAYKFKKEIGFLSKRKIARLEINTGVENASCRKEDGYDRIVSIEKNAEQEDVYDLTTSTKEFSANGIVVHNCPEEAFMTSADRLFDTEAIDEYISLAEEGKQSGATTIFRPPRQGRNYVIGADPSEGVGRDNSAAVVWEIDGAKPTVVATYASDTTQPEDFAFILKELAIIYNDALIAPERNNHGHAVISVLRRIYKEDRIYRPADPSSVHMLESSRYGFQTNVATKPLILHGMAQAVRERAVAIPSRALLTEMRLIPRDESAKLTTNETIKHYDLLMAASIGWHARQTVLKNAVVKVNYEQTRDFDPHATV